MILMILVQIIDIEVYLCMITFICLRSNKLNSASDRRWYCLGYDYYYDYDNNIITDMILLFDQTLGEWREIGNMEARNVSGISFIDIGVV